MSESSSTFYSTSQCTSTREELVDKDTNAFTQLGIDCLLASVGFSNPSELLAGPRDLTNSEPSDYNIALAISLYDRGFPPDHILKATGVNINDNPPEPVSEAKVEKAEANISSKPSQPTCFSYTSVLNSVALENLIFKELKTLHSDVPKHKLLQHIAKPGHPLGTTSGLRLIAEYWQNTFQLILHIRNAEHVTNHEFSRSPSLVASHLGVSKDRLQRVFRTSYDWPYFLQLLVTIYGPTEYYCPNATHVDNSGQSLKTDKINKFYCISTTAKDSAIYFLLPPTRIDSLLDKLTKLKTRLNTITRASPPRLRTASEILMISRTLDIERSPEQKKALKTYNTKQTTYNGGIVLNHVLEKMCKQSKLFTTHPIIIPSRIHGAFTPIPPNLFTTLVKRHGFQTPSWLTIPNLSCSSTQSLNDKLNDLIHPPIVPATAPSKLYTANRVKDHPDLVSISRTIHPDSSLIPDRFPDYLTHPDVVADTRLHIAYLSPSNSVPLTITNVISCLADFPRYETYLAQN
jgi:hypothetical protein